MIQGKDIERLVELLKRRRVSLFHACQFLDFQSYFSLGAIPSRAYLEKKVQPFTLFVTDEDDHTKDVWDKVFMNFSDFGKTFSNGHDAVPNTYGPILLQIDPAILREAIDIAICVQPVGSSNFNREKCALSSVEAVDKLFVHPADVGYPLSTWIKFKKTLSQEYKSKVCDPDISCTVRDGKLPLKYVTRILVDPYEIAGRPLQKWVDDLIPDKSFSIQKRYSYRNALYNELASLISKGISSCRDLTQISCVSEELKEWIQGIQGKDLGWQFERFATYLYNGTLVPLLFPSSHFQR